MRTLRTIGRTAIALVVVLAMVAGALLVTAPAARADHNTIAWSDPATVASSAGFSYGFSWIVADGHGSIYVFYTTTNTATSSTNLNVTKFAAVGAGGRPQKLFDAQVNDVANVVTSSYPISATIDGSGNLYVAWTRNPISTGFVVFVSKSVNGGASWQSAKMASSPSSAGDNYWPNVVAGPDGVVFVSWIQSWGGNVAVSLAHSSDAGQTYSGWTNVSSTSFVGISSLAVDSGGRLYVAYTAFSAASSSYVVNVTWSDDGATWATAQMIAAPNTSPLFPALLADSSGTVHLAWYAGLPSGGYVIEYSQSRDRGASWTGPLAITAPFSGGYVGYLAGEGDTVMYVRGSYDLTGFGFVISADHGTTWYSDESTNTGRTSLTPVAADQNGTFWAASLDASSHMTLRPWYGPPSRPMIESVVASGSNGLTVTWTPSPEQNVVDYRIYRSSDGTTYEAVGLVAGSVTSFTDSGLTNGTYFYLVTAINVYGSSSHVSAAASGVVGTTTAQLIANLESEISALQAQLNSTNADLVSLQAQLTSLRSQITSLQGTSNANNATLAQLQTKIDNLQNQLNTLQGQQATQTISYANLAFEIIVVVLLVVLLLNQMRKPKAPQMMMAQPGQAQPKAPEDDL